MVSTNTDLSCYDSQSSALPHFLKKTLTVERNSAKSWTGLLRNALDALD
jgi:hypothetical protein